MNSASAEPQRAPMKIPTISECLALMERYAMLENIRRHSLLVADVAETLVDGLAASSIEESLLPDMDLVRAGALLHDIAKTKCLDGSCRHDQEGQAICAAHGYPEVGDIVLAHVVLSDFAPKRYQAGRFSARELVYYADKRVGHDHIVSLEERRAYIIERYGNSSSSIESRIRDNFDHCLDLERQLFSFLDFTPEELAVRVDQRV